MLTTADAAALADRFDVGYARIIARGERDRIQRRWISRGTARPGAR